MGFISIMLAVFCGLCLYDISGAVMKAVIRKIENREERKIGFGESEYSGKKRDGAQMRRIGFGEHD